MLVRSAHSANIKERRDCSTALFDPDGEMVMQAEHIPVHLGAMPAAVAAVLRRATTRAGRAWVLNDPFARRHAPARHHGRHAGVRATASCSASPPAAPTTPTSAGRRPGSMPADSTTLEEEGVVIAPRVLDDAAIDELVAQMRQPAQRRADLRAQLAANRDRRARACASSPTRIGADGCARRRPRSSTTPSAARARASPRCADGDARAPSTCSRRADGDLELRLRADGRRRRADARLHRQRRAARRQPQLPARRHALGVPTSRCACSPTPTSRRAPAPTGRSTVRRARGLAAQRARAGRRRRAATSRRPRASPTSCSRAFGRALGQGTMNNLTLGNDDFTYYETLGGGQGACPDADGPSGVHVAMSQHAQHAGRGARARVPAARRRVRAAPRLGRRRPAAAAATASCAR